jgi:hypothetical protein
MAYAIKFWTHAAGTGVQTVDRLCAQSFPEAIHLAKARAKALRQHQWPQASFTIEDASGRIVMLCDPTRVVADRLLELHREPFPAVEPAIALLH